MIDYQLKAEVMALGLDSLQREVSKVFYSQTYNAKPIKTMFNYDTAISIDDYFRKKENIALWFEASKINHARYERTKRLKDRICQMLQSGNCIFLTLTFTDLVLLKTSAETRRRYVARFLKSLNCVFIANKDFGSKNGREHYHAIVQADKIDYKSYQYGSINGKKIHNTKVPVKLAKYISKLTNHAIKATTKRSAIIYSRNY